MVTTVEEKRVLNHRKIEEIVIEKISNKERAVRILNYVGRYIKDMNIKTDFDLKNNYLGLLQQPNEDSGVAFIILKEYIRLKAA